MNSAFPLALAFLLAASSAAVAQVPPFTAEDIGSTGGSTTFLNGLWTVQAEGNDIWNTADQFRYTHIQLSGDGEVVVRVISLAAVTGTLDVWAKAGVMIRQSNAAGSIHAFMAATGANGAAFQNRPTVDAASVSAGNTGGAFVPNRWLRLTRTGNVFRGYYRDDPAAAWTQVGGDVTIAMTDPLLVGLALTSHIDNSYARAEFDSLRITQNGTVIYEWVPPAPTNLDAVGGIFQIDVSWDAVTGASSYTLERATAGGGWTDTFPGLTTNSYTDTNVTPGTTYSYRVRAVFGGTNSDYSNVDSAVALLPEPRTEGSDEGLFGDDCACGSTAFPAAPGAALLSGLLLLAGFRRRRP